MIHKLIIIFIIWRVILFTTAWFGSFILQFSPRFPYSDVFLTTSGIPFWIWSFANFDGVHYLTILNQGYSAQFTQVFFPFYPLLLKLISLIIPINKIILGIGVSSLFFLAALHIFYQLLKLDYSNKQTKWIILFLVLFPTSFFFGAIYTESLFLFLVLSSFYLARQNKWWLSGLVGTLASATRLVGIFLLPALLWEWHNKNFKFQISNFKFNRNIIFSFILNIFKSPILYTVPLGLLAYMIYLQLNFGDWLYFWHVQPVFGAERTGKGIILLPQVVFRYLKIFVSIPVISEVFFISLIEFIFSLGTIILLVIGYFKKIRLSYLIFSFFILIVPALSGTFSSMPRYTLPAFPLFIVPALLNNRFYKVILLFFSAILEIILLLLFTAGHWVS